MTKYILSYGGGVDSTALLLYLLDKDMPLDAVVHAIMPDLPETHEYIAFIDRWLWKNYGMEVTYLIPHAEGTTSLLEYVLKKKFAPSKAWRWCTDKFKVRPITKWVKEHYGNDAVEYIAINADEKRRVKWERNKYGIRLKYPLVEAGIGRSEAKLIIKKHGLPVPPKSGCYICPFRNKTRLMAAKRYPCIWAQIKMVEALPGSKHPNAIAHFTTEVEGQGTLESFISLQY
ncbi:MAG: hypothetical protein H0Z19_07415 [Archaeoglobus sp.]|uniref:hypothetical protein n=1 Tax=Archaeoglobus sp. TaxID=1872626 RepID=UPI001D5743B2|nr:hypothetical protein [Archaeoglobus sp.]MBO8180293.1 hypothetical protein [Archaeoglobus sp.]